jgi:hypothetical protein
MRADLANSDSGMESVAYFPLKNKSAIVIPMTPEERSLLERTASLVEENNKILISLRRSGRWSLAMRIGYWAIIIVLSFGAFYFIQPYVQMMTGLVGGGTNAGGQSQSDLLNSLLK